MDCVTREEFEAFKTEVDIRLKKLEPVIVPGWRQDDDDNFQDFDSGYGTKIGG